MVSREQIESTEVFKGLSPSQKDLTLKRKNREEIEHGLAVANNRGIEEWERIGNPTYINKRIIRELVENK